jgi:S1-C subfamily serine protease
MVPKPPNREALLMSDNLLRSLSDSLAAAVDAGAPSLVRVQSGRRVASGIVWADGLVVTVARAVSRRHTPSVVLSDGTRHDAELVGRDPSLDLALLRVAVDGLSVAERAEGDLKVGHLVVALGRPGAGPRASLGMLASVAGAWTTSDGGHVDAFWDVDGALPPGFSGGPLLDADGRVLGLNTSGLVRGGTTLPASTVTRAVAALEENGDRSPGFLGVLFQGTKLDDEQAATAGQTKALLITGLKPRGPASAAGLKVGDLLLTVDGTPIGAWEDLAQALAGKAGEPVAARILRNGAVVDVEVAIAERGRRRC